MMSFNHSRRTVALGVIVLCCFFASQRGTAQTVRPVIVNYVQKASGSFDLVNNSPVALNVVLEPRSFQVNEQGHPSYGPLANSIHLKLSAMSFRIPPQQTYTVFYTATADTLPAWFTIYADFTGFPKRDENGLNVQLELPHVVYIRAKKPAFTKNDVRVEAAVFSRSKKTVQVTVNNLSANLGEIESAQLTGGKKKSDVGGGTLFPQKKRIFEYPWDGDSAPDKLILKFTHFQMVTAVTQEG